MSRRKQGQTNKQLVKQVQAELDNAKSNNTALRKILNDAALKTNPRTGRTYRAEAQELYITMALMYDAIKQNNLEFASAMAVGQLAVLGFSDLDIAVGNYLKDGAYETN